MAVHLVFLWRRCDAFSTSGFWMTTFFCKRRPCGCVSIPLQRVASLRRRAQANAPAASYWLRRRALRLNQSVVQGVPGAEPAIALLFLVWCRGEVGRDAGEGVPHFFRQGDASPTTPHFFGLKFVQKLVHCCNWLLTETQCKIISVEQN